MLAALIIVFREVIEAGLIVGIALAVTKQVAGSARWIAHYKGILYAGVQGSVRLYRATANDLTGPFITSIATQPGQMTTGLTVDDQKSRTSALG